MSAYQDLREQYQAEYRMWKETKNSRVTFEEWIAYELFSARTEVEVRKQFAKDWEPVYLAFQPPVTRVLVRFVVDAVDWVRETGFKVRGRPGLYKPPF